MVRNLILYVAQLVSDLDGSLGVTRLVKLLYLIDLEFYRRYRRKLTDLNWVFYKYGPYAFEFESHLRSLDLDLSEEDVRLSGGRVFRRLRALTTDVAIDDIGGQRSRIVIDRVVRDWALEDLNALLSFVYFQTEPMENPELGEPLDFGLIPRRRVEKRLDKQILQLSDEEAANLWSRLKAFREHRQAERAAAEQQRREIHRPPDPVYDEARRTMQRDEAAAPLPEALVHLEEDQE